eukprot:2280095-Rhodomonas_salina.2
MKPSVAALMPERRAVLSGTCCCKRSTGSKRARGGTKRGAEEKGHKCSGEASSVLRYVSIQNSHYPVVVHARGCCARLMLAQPRSGKGEGAERKGCSRGLGQSGRIASQHPT